MQHPGQPMMQQPMMHQPMVVMPLPAFGDVPMQLTCGNCQHTITTTVIKENGACAYIAAIFTCMLCPLCFWIPFVMESCKDTHHMCPSCGAALGSRKRM